MKLEILNVARALFHNMKPIAIVDTNQKEQARRMITGLAYIFDGLVSVITLGKYSTNAPYECLFTPEED